MAAGGEKDRFLEVHVPYARAFQVLDDSDNDDLNRAGEVIAEIGHMLRRWTLGQLCLMALVGTLTYIGFVAIGLEFAGALGLLAGLVALRWITRPLRERFGLRAVAAGEKAVGTGS